MIKNLSVAILTLATTVAFSQKIEKPAVNTRTSFAIFIDDTTYQKTTAAVRAYKVAVEKDGIGTYIISANWKNPDEIKAILKKLYNQPHKLEGAVFIGNIPVPMLRDAQHLTSTFKMDQRLNWQRSSVPSDRFYDDFDLQFRFLKQDSARSNYFYYSLLPSSPQKMGMDIYTARIKPPAIPGKDKYRMIEQYLLKAVAEKSAQNKLNDMLVFTGQGYNSESLNSWAGEQISLREQFPDLFRAGNSVKFMNYRMNTFMKFNLLSELKRNDLDLAVLHDHGAADQQLINGYPLASNPIPSIENVRRYLRSKVQAAAEDKKRDIATVKAGFAKSLGVPEAWMEDALTDSVRIADSIFNINQDINLPDLAGNAFNARFMMMDACFNGSFHLDDYIAGYYTFSGGNNIVALANTVGVLQDLWPDEMLGLLQYGVRAGNLLKETAYLETHIIGDPTFHFYGKTTTDLNAGINVQSGNVTYWKGLLKHPSADVQSLALSHLFALQGAAVSPLLKSTYFSSNNGATRMEALKLLAKLNNEDCREVLKTAITDPYEYIRRQAAYIMTDMGDDELIPLMVKLAITDRHSKRVSGKARDGLDFMNTDKVLAEISKQVSEANYLTDGQELLKQLTDEQKGIKAKVAEDLATILDTSKTLKARMFEVVTLRTYNYHSVLPQVATLILNKQENKLLRIAALEAFGWYPLSYQRGMIVETCDKVLADKGEDQEVKDMALRTMRRVAR